MCNWQWWRMLWNITKPGNDLRIPANYEQVFSDDFQQPYTNNWASGMGWGQPYNPDVMQDWYDPEQITQDSRGIHLATVQKRYLTIQNAAGVIRSLKGWKYGIFIIRAKMPKGSYMWPAIWLSGLMNWPPEIDILEGYSGYPGEQNLQSNVHFRLNNKIDDLKAKKHVLPNSETGEFIDYAVWWDPTFIRFYYNGYLVREVTQKEVLEVINEPMRLILGNGTQEGFFTNPITEFVIQKVAVFQPKKEII